LTASRAFGLVNFIDEVDMRTDFNLFHYGVLGALTLTLSGCYAVAPYGYTAYGTPVYTAYPVARYPTYAVPYAQPSAVYAPAAQPAPASGITGSVYFDVNSDVIKPEYQSLVQAQAGYLRSRPDIRVTLQGNADDRGTGGYNLALGVKRADAVKRALEGYGVPAGQLSTTSFGDKNPVNSAKDQAAYAKNRRVDFHYQP
jgi:peptidoglycan-associated lipoprotein